jgi:hypothetical protein
VRKRYIPSKFLSPKGLLEDHCHPRHITGNLILSNESFPSRKFLYVDLCKSSQWNSHNNFLTSILLISRGNDLNRNFAILNLNYRRVEANELINLLSLALLVKYLLNISLNISIYGTHTFLQAITVDIRCLCPNVEFNISQWLSLNQGK